MVIAGIPGPGQPGNPVDDDGRRDDDDGDGPSGDVVAEPVDGRAPRTGHGEDGPRTHPYGELFPW